MWLILIFFQEGFVPVIVVRYRFHWQLSQACGDSRGSVIDQGKVRCRASEVSHDTPTGSSVSRENTNETSANKWTPLLCYSLNSNDLWALKLGHRCIRFHKVHLWSNADFRADMCFPPKAFHLCNTDMFQPAGQEKVFFQCAIQIKIWWY